MKDRLLGQSRSQHASAIADRDTLRIELGKLGALFRGKQSGVDEQVRLQISDTETPCALSWAQQARVVLR
jgi:hypothetical protein